MKNQEITVFYKWTAKPGKLAELKAIYQEVYKEMKENEPDSLKMECYIADEENAIIVHDLFKDGAALGTHLGGTAAHHFPKEMFRGLTTTHARRLNIYLSRI